MTIHNGLSEQHEQHLLLKPEQAAKLLNIGRTTLYELLATDAVESVKVGRRRLIPRSALLEFVERLRCQHRTGEDLDGQREADKEAEPAVVDLLQ